ncbi:CatA-like O-acetyltransferase [Maridesulfovibrio sp. FT414]|uniref:CatA-like O-acetyltransferase n=1 Tax=Maridesulfovibrio sp. FT414 TaxID=2979469 RepID=UPI003D80950C
MSANYCKIDMESWKRKEHCQVFMNAVQPQYCIGFDLDVTNFADRVKKEGLSFTLAFTYAVAKCANQIEEFRYRFIDKEVVLFHKINTMFTYLDNETELFKVVSVQMQETMAEYVELALATAERQEKYFDGPVGDDVFVFSALPWITFTHVSHTYFGDRWKAQPLFDWGKYVEKEGRLILPFAVQVHHAFVDGIHIGKLATRLQNYLDVF